MESLETFEMVHEIQGIFFGWRRGRSVAGHLFGFRFVVESHRDTNQASENLNHRFN